MHIMVHPNTAWAVCDYRACYLLYDVTICLGELLGSTMNNLGRLLRTPSGCGEQNMLSFAPDVFVTLYLHTADLLDATTREKAFKHFQDGYSNELR